MSAYKKISTEYRTLESLLKALGDLKIKVETTKDFRTPDLTLYDWHGQPRPQKASVVVRRDVVNRKMSGGNSNDVGFAWNGQSFDAIVSEFDQGCLGVQQHLTQLKQRYAYHETCRQARLKGYTVREHHQPDGTIRLTLTHN